MTRYKGKTPTEFVTTKDLERAEAENMTPKEIADILIMPRIKEINEFFGEECDPSKLAVAVWNTLHGYKV